ncbi:MAG TPA: hypothetical protein VEP89_18775 [Draconibacterium sp.]|nr:hypothetical protein [Draconibacterium sp.]
MTKFLLFIAFLLTYTAYLVVSYFIVNKTITKYKKTNFIENALIILLFNIFFFAFIFVIGRFINIKLLAISLIASNIGLIFASIVWGLIGNSRTPFTDIGAWIGSDLGRKNPKIMVIGSILSLLVLIAFPVIIGFVHFSNDAIEIIRIQTIKYSSLLIISLTLLMLPLIIGILTSPYIDKDTRARYFINQFSGMLAYSLFISLLFWTLNYGEAGTTINVGDISFIFSPVLLVIILGYLFLFLILPYLIGVHKSKQLRSYYLENNVKILDKIIEVINLSAPEDINDDIEQIKTMLVDEYNTLSKSDVSVITGLNYDRANGEDEIPAEDLSIFRSYKLARNYDIRFTYYDFLNSTYLKLEDITDKIQKHKNNPDERKKLRESYNKHFESYKEDLNHQNSGKSKSNPALWVAIITVLTPIFSQLMSEFGKFLIDIFKNL